MIYKRSKIYWYEFMWEGQLIREYARQMESAHRTARLR